MIKGIAMFLLAGAAIVWAFRRLDAGARQHLSDRDANRAPDPADMTDHILMGSASFLALQQPDMLQGHDLGGNDPGHCSPGDPGFSDSGSVDSGCGDSGSNVS